MVRSLEKLAGNFAAITDKASMDLVKVNIVNISYWNEKTKVGQEDYTNAPKGG